MNSPRTWHRLVQGLLLMSILVTVQGQTACEARSRSTNPPPPTSPGTPGTPQPRPPAPGPDIATVTGNERIAWDHEVEAGTRPGSMTFAAFLDGARVDFPGVSCTARSNTFHECSAPLPRMERGAHTLRLAAIGPPDNPLFSPRSRVLNLIKVDPGAPAAAVPSVIQDAPKTGAGFSLDVISDANGPIADIAAGPEGIAFAAETTGRILTTGSDGMVEALRLRDLARRGGAGLTSIALHPDFDKNRLVYFAYTGEGPSGPVWRLARGRELNGRIGEVAVLMDGEPAAAGSSAVIRFGPDRQLYFALGSDPVQRSGSGTYNGRMLRLTDDGRRATNNKDGSPVVDTVSGAPAGLTWADDLRLLQTRAGDRHELSIVQGTTVLTRFAWEPGRRPAALAYSTGWLYIATLDRGLQRVQWPPPKGGIGHSDASLAPEYTGIRAVAVASDGTIFLGTANPTGDRTRPGAAAGKNYLIRLRPR